MPLPDSAGRTDACPGALRCTPRRRPAGPGPAARRLLTGAVGRPGRGRRAGRRPPRADLPRQRAAPRADRAARGARGRPPRRPAAVADPRAGPQHRRLAAGRPQRPARRAAVVARARRASCAPTPRWPRCPDGSCSRLDDGPRRRAGLGADVGRVASAHPTRSRSCSARRDLGSAARPADVVARAAGRGGRTAFLAERAAGQAAGRRLADAGGARRDGLAARLGPRSATARGPRCGHAAAPGPAPVGCRQADGQLAARRSLRAARAAHGRAGGAARRGRAGRAARRHAVAHRRRAATCPAADIAGVAADLGPAGLVVDAGLAVGRGDRLRRTARLRQVAGRRAGRRRAPSPGTCRACRCTGSAARAAAVARRAARRGSRPTAGRLPVVRRRAGRRRDRGDAVRSSEETLMRATSATARRSTGGRSPPSAPRPTWRGCPPDVAQVAVRMIHACGMVDLRRRPRRTRPAWSRRPRARRCAAARRSCATRRWSPPGSPAPGCPRDNEVICTLRDPRVPALAATLGTTRSAAALELWRDRLDGAVVAIGNAPTALFRLLEMIAAGAPAAGRGARHPGRLHRRGRVQGGPGRASDGVPYLVVRGRRGGSAMTAAAVNALAARRSDAVTTGRLCGVGLGPGDPELVTVKAARLIGDAPTWSPTTAPATAAASPGRSPSRTCATGQIEEALVYPVTTETHRPPGRLPRARWTSSTTSAAARLAAHLDAGRDVVVLARATRSSTAPTCTCTSGWPTGTRPRSCRASPR